MDRTAVPETAIDEDSDLLRDEHQVGSSPAAREHSPIDAIAETSRVQGSTERDLRSGIALTRSQHAVSSFD
jgi:hypothetical protein